MEKSIAMENVSINCSSCVYIGSDVKGKCSVIKCLGISSATANALRPSYRLQSISFCDLVLSYENVITDIYCGQESQEQNQHKWQHPDLPEKI